MPQRPSELRGGPSSDFRGARESGPVDVDHRGVRSTQLVDVLQRGRVQVFGQLQPVTAGLGQADDFFEPGGARGLQVQASPGAADRSGDGPVNGELVAARVDAELELGGQAIASDGLGDNGQVVVELSLELGDITDIIHALVEAAGEFRRDGLHGHTGLSQCCQDDHQGRRGLRRIGFIHGYLGDEASDAFDGGDVPIQRPGLLSGLEELGGDPPDILASRDQRFGNTRYDLDSDQLGMPFQEGFDCLGCGRLTNEIGHIDGVEVAVRQEASHCFQADMIGIQEVRSHPAEGRHGGIGGGTGGRGLRTDDGVLAVGLVPDRNDFDTLF